MKVDHQQEVTEERFLYTFTMSEVEKILKAEIVRQGERLPIAAKHRYAIWHTDRSACSMSPGGERKEDTITLRATPNA